MRTCVAFSILLCTASALATEAVLVQRITIPEAALSTLDTKEGVAQFGGDLRIGDLDHDGTVDFVIAKSLGGMKTCYIAAFNWQGELRWEWGDKNRTAESADKPDETYQATPPSRPGPLLVVDIDGDNETEVAAMVLKPDVKRTNIWDTRDVEFIILDGTSGEVKHRASPEPLLQAHANDAKGKRQEPNYVHQRLLAADLRGRGVPNDLVIKIGDTLLACNHELVPLWLYRNRFSEYGEHASYIPAVGDVDNDGHDEVAGGQFLRDHDRKVLWEKSVASHNDSVAIVDWDGDRANGKEIVCSGWGHVLNAKGDALLQLGKEAVPHGQEVRCGEFLTDEDGIELAIRYNGHKEDIMIVDRDGKIRHRFKVDPSPINVGLETVYWFGRHEPALLYSPAAMFNGKGEKIVTLPNLPPASERGRMGWHQCIPADLDGDASDEIVLFDPYTDEVFIYSAANILQDPPTGYRHTERQWNVRLMD